MVHFGDRQFYDGHFSDETLRRRMGHFGVGTFRRWDISAMGTLTVDTFSLILRNIQVYFVDFSSPKWSAIPTINVGIDARSFDVFSHRANVI